MPPQTTGEPTELRPQTFSRVDAVKPPGFRRSFRTRVFMYITILSLITSATSAAIYYWRQLGFIEKDRSRRAHTLLTSLATQAELGAYASDAALCELAARRTFAEEDVVMVAIYDRHGREILHFATPDLGIPPPSREAMVRMLTDGESRPARLTNELFDDLYAPIVTGARDPVEALSIGPASLPPRREVVGVARVGLSLRPAREQLAEMLRWGVLLAVLVLFVGVLAAMLIARRVSRPIAALTRGAEQIRAGKLDTRVTVDGDDELGHLGHAFNRMAARLAETMNALEALNRDLEAEVERRTLAIQRAADFTRLLNAPVDGEDAAQPAAPSAATAVIGEARGQLAQLLDAALGALIAGTHARGGGVLLTSEEAVDVELEVSRAVGVKQIDELAPFPTEQELLRGPTFDGARMVVPLRTGADVSGCVILFLEDKPPDDRVQFAVHAAQQLTIAVANARAFEAQIHLAGELRERNLALGKQRDQLQEMNRLKSEFLANTSHELRTPLNAIIGYGELLTDGIYGAMAKEQLDPLAGIDESARTLLALINNILDLSKVESGKMQLVVEDVDVVEVVRTVLAEVAPLAKDKPYRVELIAGGPLPLRTDGAKLQQIVTNLVSNAIKFTAEGSVTVEVRGDAGGGIIAVKDTGIGIRPEDQRIIFEEFRQLDGSATRTYGGTGLGLAIARRLAQLLGGDVSVQSAPGAGSTFTLRLPREPPPPPLPKDQITGSMKRVTLPPPLPPGAQSAKA